MTYDPLREPTLEELAEANAELRAQLEASLALIELAKKRKREAQARWRAKTKNAMTAYLFAIAERDGDGNLTIRMVDIDEASRWLYTNVVSKWKNSPEFLAELDTKYDQAFALSAQKTKP